MSGLNRRQFVIGLSAAALTLMLPHPALAAGNVAWLCSTCSTKGGNCIKCGKLSLDGVPALLCNSCQAKIGQHCAKCGRPGNGVVAASLCNSCNTKIGNNDCFKCGKPT